MQGFLTVQQTSATGVMLFAGISKGSFGVYNVEQKEPVLLLEHHAGQVSFCDEFAISLLAKMQSICQEDRARGAQDAFLANNNESASRVCLLKVKYCRHLFGSSFCLSILETSFNFS